MHARQVVARRAQERRLELGNQRVFICVRQLPLIEAAAFRARTRSEQAAHRWRQRPALIGLVEPRLGGGRLYSHGHVVRHIGL